MREVWFDNVHLKSNRRAGFVSLQMTLHPASALMQSVRDLLTGLINTRHQEKGATVHANQKSVAGYVGLSPDRVG